MKCLSSKMRTLITGGVLLGLCATGACGSGGDSGPQTGGQSSQGSQGGQGGTAAGGSTGDQKCAVGGNAAGGTSSASAGGTRGTSTYPNVGVCGESGNATADDKTYEGHETRYIIGEGGFGTKVCQVQFDLKRVGDAPPCCTDCAWTHLLEYSNPQVLTDSDGACGQSDLALDAAAIAKIVGSRVAIGFAPHLGGAHGSARMRYFEDSKMWDVTGNANWSEATKAFSYDFRDGYCNYGP